MEIITHIASGYLAYRIIDPIGKQKNKTWLLATVIGSLLPDIDGLIGILRGTYLNSHRYTIFHAPLFWFLFIFIAIIIAYLYRNKKAIQIMLLILLGVILHLILDWIGGRTAGIMIWYPFSKQISSLFSLQPEKGAIPMLPGKHYLEFIKLYFSNKYLVVFEFFINATAIVMYIHDKLRKRLVTSYSTKPI